MKAEFFSLFINYVIEVRDNFDEKWISNQSKSQFCDFNVEHNGRTEPCRKMREQLQLQICIIYNVHLFDTSVFILFSMCVWCHAEEKLVVFLAAF